MSFHEDIRKFNALVQRRRQAVFVGTVAAVKHSIVEGSPITGAPGQPVDSGQLKGSWHDQFLSPTKARVSTNVVYARSIEDGVSYAHGGRPITLRSAVGGFHSVKLTRGAFPQLVAEVVREVRVTIK